MRLLRSFSNIAVICAKKLSPLIIFNQYNTKRRRGKLFKIRMFEIRIMKKKYDFCDLRTHVFEL